MTLLERLLNREDLSEAEAEQMLYDLADANHPPALAGALLAALRAKGETADEIRGFARAMRARAIKPDIPPGTPTIDTVGTGGDASGSLNLSTGTGILAAACGLRVVKHGNRSVSSLSGSADVLEALGYRLPATPQQAVDSLTQTGFTFLFAPHYHPAMKAIAPVRQAMKVRTVFNLLGPLTNPAEPPFMLIGAYSPDAARLMAHTLSGLPIERAFVVHGEPGWDEATPVGPFLLLDARPGAVSETTRDPKDYRLKRCSAAALAGGDAAHNAAALARVLRGEDQGPHCDALVLGAALMLELSGTSASFRAATALAREAIGTGRGATILSMLAAFGH